MKIALQEGVYNAGGFADFVKDAARWGLDGVEISGDGLPERIGHVASVLDGEGMRAVAVCPGLKGIGGSLLSDDESERARAGRDIHALIECCDRLGGAGLVLVPEFGAKKFMALYPDHGDYENRAAVFAERFSYFAHEAQSLGVPVYIEPLNRYEAYFLLTLEQGAKLCRLIGGPAYVLADMFHMGIEERDPVGAVKRHGAMIGHVHAVDNNRLLPGQGCRDFAPLIEALASHGYSGSLCIESGVAGDPRVEIPAAVARLREYGGLRC